MTEKFQENIAKAHDNSIYSPSRIVWLTGSIDIDKYDEVCKNLITLDQTPAEITIYLNSDGGELTHAFAIYDIIKSLKSHIKIIVIGEACSSAAYILQAADERIMFPNSQLMVHIGEEGHSSNHPKNIDAWYKRNKEMGITMTNEFLIKIKEKDITYTKNKVDKLLVFDTILVPKKALELGLIDKILEV